MRALLARISPQQALGVYVGERTVTVCHVAATLLGPVQLDCRCQPYEGEQLGTVLETVLRQAIGRRNPRRLPVALALAPQRVFFSMRPIRAANVDAAPDVLLHEMLQSPNVSIDDMAVDVVRAQPGKRPVAGIASCRKKYLAGLLTMIGGCGLRVAFAEPGPCALLRAAMARHRAPFRTRTVLRVFLGDHQGLAVAVTGSLPVVWRPLFLQPGGEGAELCSVARRIEAILSYCGVDSAIDAILAHGRPELRDSLDGGALQETANTRVLWHDGPPLDDEAVAFGVALGGLQGCPGFDLARSMKPPPTLRDIFPRGELAVQGALLLCMGLFLNFTAQGHAQACRMTEAACGQYGWVANRSEADLAKEKKNLEARVNALRRFTQSRVLWSQYLKQVAACLPEKARLDSFLGYAELATTNRSKGAASAAKRQLVLQASAPMAASGGMPHEIEELLSALRSPEHRLPEFPTQMTTDIRLSPATPSQPARASVTAVCLPKTAPKGAQTKTLPAGTK